MDHIGLAMTVAHRVGRRDEDVEQVALLGLVKAAQRFDPERGVSFGTYAWATVEGEVKRYFRDSTWSQRVDRSLQERSLAVKAVVEMLTADLGRAPTPSEIADQVGCTPEEALEALDLRSRCRTVGFSAVDGGADMSCERALGVEGGFDIIDDRSELARALRYLRPRERVIVWLRFGEELSQAEIGERLGLSQMHVSRLLEKSLRQLREMVCWQSDQAACHRPGQGSDHHPKVMQ